MTGQTKERDVTYPLAKGDFTAGMLSFRSLRIRGEVRYTLMSTKEE
jgi:hypothetical protein